MNVMKKSKEITVLTIFDKEKKKISLIIIN